MERDAISHNEPKSVSLDEKDVGMHPDGSHVHVQVVPELPELPKLQRKLKSRHLQMIAMGQ